MKKENKHSAGFILGNFFLAVLWATFLYSHIFNFVQTRHTSDIVFAVMASIVALLFLFRSPANTLSQNPLEWAVAILGTFCIMLIRPDWNAVSPIGEGLVYLGALISILSYLSIGTSMGIVPANRGVRTGGLYRFVRHPMYTGYFVCLLGYLLTNFTQYNLRIAALTIGLYLWRVVVEERHLLHDPQYLAYSKRVRKRFVPYVI